MQNIAFGAPMTASDTFVFLHVGVSRRLIIELSGEFGGATGTLGYLSPSGNFVSFKQGDGVTPIALTSDDGVIIEVPKSGNLAVLLEGAGGSTNVKFTNSPAAF